ncbi:pyrroline-5-carboxylate reductase [Acidobacteria bacterium AH-259-A15]|nr:pyrroline-5-carboxylate reductase [Acidobacteria bacterium AH-259-A15]
MKKPIKKRVGFLGLGKMGGILLRALFEQKILLPKHAIATVRHTERAQALSQELGIPVTTDNVEAARRSDLILICVKPNTVSEVLEKISPEMSPDKLLISIAASVPTPYIEGILSAEIPVVRAMPNTPCEVGCGMTGICSGRFADDSHLEIAEALFKAVGMTVVLDEKHMDAVTGLSASGPAFVYIILESLAEAGVKVGLSRDIATLLVAQTVQGAARVALQTGRHPALLKDAVTTPAGCTIDGILELEEGKLRVTLIKAVVKATERAKELLLAD